MEFVLNADDEHFNKNKHRMNKTNYTLINRGFFSLQNARKEPFLEMEFDFYEIDISTYLFRAGWQST